MPNFSIKSKYLKVKNILHQVSALFRPGRRRHRASRQHRAAALERHNNPVAAPPPADTTADPHQEHARHQQHLRAVGFQGVPVPAHNEPLHRPGTTEGLAFHHDVSLGHPDVDRQSLHALLPARLRAPGWLHQDRGRLPGRHLRGVRPLRETGTGLAVGPPAVRPQESLHREVRPEEKKNPFGPGDF